MDRTEDRTSFRGTDAERRRFLQGGLAASVAGLVGLSGFAGSAAGRRPASGSPTLEPLGEDFGTTELEAEAGPLLNRLAADGVIPKASGDVFPDHGYHSSDRDGGVTVYRIREADTVERSIVGYFETGKVEVNVPERGEAYASFTPRDGSERVRIYRRGIGGFDVRPIDKTGGVSAGNCYDSTCSYCDCSDGGPCWWEKQLCCWDCWDGDCKQTCSCGCE